MSMLPAVSPFVPGRGGLPPYLAGRDNEQHALKRLLAYLEHGKGAPRDVIVVGPRGNGKTVLLRWFQREIEADETKIDTVWLTPSDIRSLDGLATELVPPRRYASLRPESLSFSVGIGRLGWELGDRPASLTRLLAARCRQRALVVLLDEAHDLDKDVANVLLNASQSVAADAPILLVLAGTPGLQAHLNTISATFWNRARQIGVGRLDAEATSAALIRPLAAQSPAIAFEDAALAEVVAESQGYPYFVQLWGDALWQAANDSAETRVGDALVTAARRSFDRERTDYYEDRRYELDQRGLAGVSVSVAAAFRESATLTGRALKSAIAAALPGGSNADTLQFQEKLASVGYVWRSPGAGNLWEPGIPSLMSYIEATERHGGATP